VPPLLSVVIPTCNRAGMVGAAIRSALDQTLTDQEILVFDDASDDETSQVVAAVRDPRVIYLRGEGRRGGAAARNAAIRHSRGAYLAFLDDDDEWFPQKLERQMEVFRGSADAPGLVYSSYVVVDRETGRVVGKKIASKKGDVSREILASNLVGGSSCVIVRREAVEEAGLFDEALPSFQDYDLWIRLSRLVRFDFVAEPMLRYFVHEKKIWRDFGALDRGIERMLQKHGRSRALRRNLGRQSLWVGVHRCREGEPALGRRSMLRALKLNPLGLRTYVHLGLSLLGGSRYRRWSDARQKRRTLRREEA
jgi:glycosyltransferase involved in cell wall biosynthesis